MLSWIRQKLAPTLYIQIWENKIKVTDITTRQVYEDLPLVAIQTFTNGVKKATAFGKDAKSSVAINTVKVNPFSHPRVLFSDFYVGEKLLEHAFSTFAKYRFLRVRPRTVIQPMEKIEGGLTMIEVRAFREVVFGAGSIENKVYTGQPLSIALFNFDQVQDIDGINRIGGSQQGDKDVGLMTVLMLALVIVGVLYFGN